MKKISFAPVNSLVFVSDNLRSLPPVPVRGSMVNYNEFCVSVGCYPEIDGETEIFLGRMTNVEAGLQLVFDGILQTPNKTLIVWTVDDEILLQDDVTDTETRVRILLSHPKWPEKVVVGWG
jgi:hypothetical protein